MESIEAQIREVTSRIGNIIYLQNEMAILPETDICIYGTTLWSHIKDNERFSVVTQISDYQCIPHMTIDRSNELFRDNVSKLADVLNNHQDKRFIVVSHHLPTEDLIHEKYRLCKINSAFASQVNIANNPQIVAWVAGHTHTPIIKNKFYVNPIGYPGENQIHSFNEVFTLTE
jgi:hypothetical protein